jgi:hypothetical protein
LLSSWKIIHMYFMAEYLRRDWHRIVDRDKTKSTR